jgi:tetratricopeptide (TPR) repeat protein
MASRLYMVIDERRDHSFRLPRPDLSVELGTTNACNKCHTKPSENAQWAADAIKKWYGERPKRDPHWGPAIQAGREGKPEGEKLLLDLIARASTPPIVKATAIDLLAGYPSNASVNARREALHDADPLVRLTAVQVIPADNEKLLVLNLVGVIDDSVRAVRIAAATRLAQFSGLARVDQAGNKIENPLDALTDSQRKAFEKAMVEFRESQELSLDHAGGHLVFASFDRRQGRIDEAIQHLMDAVKLEPYLAGPRSELASLMQEHGGDPAEIKRLRTDEAELVERDSKLAPDNADIFYRLGLLRYTLGDYDKADAAFQQACEKAPRNYEYLMALALLEEKRYVQTGDTKYFNAAAESLKKMHDLNKGDVRAQQIFERLLAVWHERNPNAKGNGGKN